MKELYLKIIEVLESQDAKDKYEAAGLPSDVFVDIYSGQYLDWENFESFPHPAVLFEWSVNYESEPAIAGVSLHLCFEQLRDTSSLSPFRELSLKFFDFLKITHGLVNGLETELTGALERTNEVPQQMNSIVNVQVLSYTCSYEEEDIEKYNYHEPEHLNITKNINLFKTEQ